jgi:hypothetical protein
MIESNHRDQVEKRLDPLLIDAYREARMSLRRTSLAIADEIYDKYSTEIDNFLLGDDFQFEYQIDVDENEFTYKDIALVRAEFRRKLTESIDDAICLIV